MKVVHIFPVALMPYVFLKDFFLKNNEKNNESVIYCGYDEKFNDLVNDLKEVEINNTGWDRKFSLINTIIYFIKAIRIINKEKKNIIVLHSPVYSALFSVASILYKPKKIIFICHGIISIYKKTLKEYLIFLVEKFTFYMADEVVFVSNSLAQEALDKKYLSKNKKIIIINSICGVNIKKINPRYNIQNPIRLGYFGRIADSKGYYDIYDVSKKLSEWGCEHEFYVAGDVENYEKFDKINKKFKNVNYMNFINDKNYYFSKIDLLLVPSLREGFGMAALEANSFGVPVIGYNITGLCDAIKNNETGYLVPVRNTCQLALKVMKYKRDIEIYKNHSKNGINRANSQFNKDEIIEKLINIVNNCRKDEFKK